MQRQAIDLKHHHVVLKGERLILETLTTSNMSERYADWIRDPLVNKYLEVRHDPEAAAAGVAHFVANTDRSGRELLLGMFLPGDHRHIGNIKLGSIDFRNRRCDVGLLVGERDYWGQGLGGEALRMATDYALEVLRLNRLGAGIIVSNTASVRLFEKAGYRRECVHRQYVWLEDGYEDCYWYVRLAGER